MKIIGIRFCSVSQKAKDDLDFFENKLGLTNTLGPHTGFVGGVFPTEDQSSWVECWQASEQMPEGLMLQLVVENSDEFATNVKANGVEAYGPVDAHGERIYYIKTPSGVAMSFQSKI